MNSNMGWGGGFYWQGGGAPAYPGEIGYSAPMSRRHIRPVIQQGLDQQRPSAHKDNVRYRVLGRVVRKANELREQRGLPSLPVISPHALRRTYIRLLIEAGAPLPYVMRQGWPRGLADHFGGVRAGPAAAQAAAYARTLISVASRGELAARIA